MAVSVALNLDYYAAWAGRGCGLRQTTHQAIVLSVVRSIHSRGPSMVPNSIHFDPNSLLINNIEEFARWSAKPPFMGLNPTQTAKVTI